MSAQTPMSDSFATYSVYPEVSEAGHKPPKGYKPFYISHLSRHGSRRLSKPEYYSVPLGILEKAHAKGWLTPEGESLLRDMSALAEEAKGREGLLVPRGEREHREIMDRMCDSYPEVFRGKGRKVHAMSSEVMRTVMSMSCAMEELRSRYPELEIERECGPGITGRYYRNEGRRKAGKLAADSKADIVAAAKPSRFTAVMLRDSSVLSDKEARRLLEGVWECAAAARMHDDLGIDLNKYLCAEDVEGCWKQRNRFMYLTYGPSGEYGRMVLADMDAMMRDIIDRADSAIAKGDYCADFRFGHDVQVIPVAALMGIEGCTIVADDSADALPDLYDTRKISPMAANIQLVFYRSRRNPEVLVKVLLNERESRLNGVPDDLWPYYRWEDVKSSFEKGGNLRVAFIGDLQVSDEAALGRVRKSVLADLAGRKDIDFAVLAGDLVEEHCDLLPEVKAAFDSLPFPVFAVPGNHDRDGALLGTRSLDTWNRVFGYTDTTFVAKDVRFILLNSVRNSRVRPKRDYVIGTTAAQKEWLSSVLAGSEQQYNVIVTHGQLSKAHAGADSLYGIVSSRSGVFLVEAHTHRAARSVWKGVDELNVGAPYALGWGEDSRMDLMNCGAPRGYFVADINTLEKPWLELEFRSLVPGCPGQAHATIDGKGRLLVNVHAGAEYGEVKVDGKPLKRLKEVCPETQDLLSRKAEGIPAKKISSSHIWGTKDPVTDKYAKGDRISLSYSDTYLKFTETITIQ